MAVVIRLRRTGRKNLPCYRINVTDSRFPRDGRMIETIGLYDPLRKDKATQIVVDAERARYWVSQGAKVSDIVASIFRRQGGVLEPKKKVKRERPKRKVATATRKNREAVNKARLEAKAARLVVRKQQKRAAAKAKEAAPAAS